MVFQRFKSLSLICISSICLLAYGCGGGAASSSGNGSESGITFTGSSSVSGTVIASTSDLSLVGASYSSLSSLTTQAQLSSVSSHLRVGLTSQAVLNGGIIKVFGFNDEGDLIDTGISGEIDDNGVYDVSGLADDQVYLFVAVKVGEVESDVRRVFRQSTFVSVGDAESSVDADNTQITHLYSALMANVVAEAQDAGLPSGLMDELEEAVASAAASEILSGLLSVRSNVDTVLATVELDDIYEFSFNDELQQIGEDLANNSRVADLIQKIVLNVKRQKGDNLGFEGAKEYIRQVMGISDATEKGADPAGGSRIPDFFLNEFATAYLNETEVTVTEFVGAFYEALPSQIATELSESGMVSTLISDMSQAMTTHYTQMTTSASADISPVQFVLFPEEESSRWSTITESTVMNMDHVLFFMAVGGYTNGGFLPDEVRSEMGDQQGPPFNPIALMQAMGMVQDLEPDEPVIVDFEIIPVRAHVQVSPGQWGETDAIMSRVVPFMPDGSTKEVGSVILKYTDTNNEIQTVTYSVSSMEGQGAPVSSLKALEYNQSLSSQTDNPYSTEYRIEPWEWEGNPSPTIISDFKSGEVSVIVKDTNGDTLLTETREIYKFGLSRPSFSSLGDEDAENINEGSFDGDHDLKELDLGEQDSIRPTFRWSEATGTLPDHMKIVYAINVGLSARKIDSQSDTFGGQTLVDGGWDHESTEHGYRWKRIWESWDHGRFLKRSQFTLPSGYELEATTFNVAENVMTVYEVNVRPLVIDERSKRVVYEGSEGRTSIKVGAVNYTVNLNGTISFPTAPENLVENGDTVNWKVGLFTIGRPGTSISSPWVEVFNHNSGENAPVEIDGSPAVDTLSISNNEADYDLPDFTKDNTPIANRDEYQLIVWADSDDDGRIDVGSEFFDFSQGNVRNGPEGLMLHYWSKENNGDHGMIFLTIEGDTPAFDFDIAHWHFANE